MSIDIANALASQVPAADWDKLAAQLNISVDVLKDKVASAYAVIPTAPEPRLVVGEGLPAKRDDVGVDLF